MPLAASMDDEKDVSGELESFKGQVRVQPTEKSHRLVL